MNMLGNCTAVDKKQANSSKVEIDARTKTVDPLAFGFV